MNLISPQHRVKALALPALVLAAPMALAADSTKFEALLTVGISRDAAVALMGSPDRETCNTTMGVRLCRLEWETAGLFATPVAYQATFLGDRLVAKSMKSNPRPKANHHQE
jgi:hypothetical protein